MSGSIRQLKENYWLLRVDQGRDPLTGRRIQASRTVSGNRKAAERALDELKFTIPLKIWAKFKYGTDFLGLNDTREINLNGTITLNSVTNLFLF